MSDISPDEDAILALNEAHYAETSTLTAERLHALLGQAFHVGLRKGGRDAFLIALDHEAMSSSSNFQWFKSRYKRFVYIDRVIVVPSKRGQGLARELYEELFAAALHAGHHLIGCEVNVEPPNPASDAFHEAMGFSEVGRGTLPHGEKVVRYMMRDV